MPLGIVKVQIIANVPSSIRYHGPKSASKPRNEKNTIVPINGPSIRPMPPMTTSDNRHCRNEDADDDGNGTDGH